MAHPANSPHGNDDYTANMFGPSSPSSEKGEKDDVSWLFGPSPRQKAKRAALSPLARVALVGALIVGPTVMLTSHHGVSGASADSITLPMPQNVQVEQDDRNARLWWGDVMRPDRPNPAGVVGYYVTWCQQGGSCSHGETPYRAFQVQPLTNGQPYTATIQAVDTYGHLGPASAPVSFTGSSARVDALRQQMTGFFDDGNLPAGQLNPLKWATAVSVCAQGAMSGNAVNAQFHYHTMASDSRCDRGQVTARPRATFDFTNRTGTIIFDLDGAQRRDNWYLDLLPAGPNGQPSMDLDCLVNLDVSNDNCTAPALRFKDDGSGAVSIFYVDAQGNETNVSQIPNGDTWMMGPGWKGVPLIQNYRRHWVIHVSQTHADVSIDGQTVVQASLNLPFTKATVLWDNFSYNTPKGNDIASLQHWDNFGFDGPASAAETHDYLDGNYDGAMDAAMVAGDQTRPITIPDSLAGATAARLMFTIQSIGVGSPGYVSASSDAVIVNGHSVALPPDNGPSASVAGDYIHSYPVVLPLDPSWLRTGSNAVDLHLHQAGVSNLHVEVDYPQGTAPAYTPPAYTNPMAAAEAMDIPPGNTTQTLNGQWMGFAGTYAQNVNKVFPVSGTISLPLTGDKQIELDATGKDTGIARVQVLLDGRTIYDQRTDADVPAPQVNIPWTLDTTTIPNGTHTLLVRMYDAAGTASIPDYFESDITTPQDWPFTLDVENAGSTVTSAPIAMATATPAPPTATATSIPVSPSATSQPSASPTRQSATATPSALSVSINSVTASPVTVAPGSTINLAGTITANAALSGAIVDFEVYNAAGAKVYQAWQSSVGLSGAASRTLNAKWTVPQGQAAGIYTVKLGVFGPGWTPMYAWANSGASLTIGAVPAAAPANTSVPPTATATNTPVPPTATATATNTPVPPTATATNTPVPPTATVVPAGSASTLGLTTVGSVQDGYDSQNMNGSRVVVGTQSETIKSISTYIGAVDAAPHNQFSFGVYTDDNGKPGTLVAQSAPGTLNANGWNTLPVQATLKASTAYWLEYNTNGTNGSVNNMYYSNDPGNVGAYTGASFGQWPSSFGAASVGGWRFSIYASVTP